MLASKSMYYNTPVFVAGVTQQRRGMVLHGKVPIFESVKMAMEATEQMPLPSLCRRSTLQMPVCESCGMQVFL